MYYPDRGEIYYSAQVAGFGGLSLASRPMPESMPAFSMESSHDRVADVGMRGQPGPSGSGGSAPPPKAIEIRKTFPETWLFESFDFNSR